MFLLHLKQFGKYIDDYAEYVKAYVPPSLTASLYEMSDENSFFSGLAKMLIGGWSDRPHLIQCPLAKRLFL